jgi:hypothetical protein
MFIEGQLSVANARYMPWASVLRRWKLVLIRNVNLIKRLLVQVQPDPFIQDRLPQRDGLACGKRICANSSTF